MIYRRLASFIALALFIQGASLADVKKTFILPCEEVHTLFEVDQAKKFSRKSKTPTINEPVVYLPAGRVNDKRWRHVILPNYAYDVSVLKVIRIREESIPSVSMKYSINGITINFYEYEGNIMKHIKRVIHGDYHDVLERDSLFGFLKKYLGIAKWESTCSQEHFINNIYVLTSTSIIPMDGNITDVHYLNKINAILLISRSDHKKIMLIYPSNTNLNSLIRVTIRGDESSIKAIQNMYFSLEEDHKSLSNINIRNKD